MDPANIDFVPASMYDRDHSVRSRIIRLVVEQAPPEAYSATVVNGWHTSRSDRRQHCTVDYKDINGVRIRRRHIV
ncbi:hypothetical protein F4802DRAFT_599106 [Xylaria palmicola]|nr:hypothetical protein F4802DRAFT_599106 [Xylaria palmicola]